MIAPWYGPDTWVTVQSEDKGNTFGQTGGTLEVPDALERNVTHGPETPVHRRLLPRTLSHRRTVPPVRHQSKDRLQNDLNVQGIQRVIQEAASSR